MMELLFLLFIKHWYFDFSNQSQDEIDHKGDYLHWLGIKHSLKHGIGTFAVFFVFSSVPTAMILAMFDSFLHYHIDYVKMHYGIKDIKEKKFWEQLGLDQLAHNLTYLFLVSIYFWLV